MTALSLSKVVADALAEVGAEPDLTPPPKGRPRKTTWIGTEHAFGIRDYASGRSVYFVQTRMAGRLRTVTIGSVAVITRHQAESVARRVFAHAQVGNDPATERRRIRSAPRFDDFLGEYWQRWSPRWKASTLVANTGYRKRYLDAAFSGLFIDEIDDEHVVKWFTDLNNRTSYGAANRTFSTLNHIFNKAEEWGYRPANTNPCRAVRRRRDRRCDRFLSEGELGQLGIVLDEARAGTDPIRRSVADAIMLLVLTGCRSSEIMGMKWSDVRGNRLTLHDSKTGPRTVWLGEDTRAVIKAMPKHRDVPWLFWNARLGIRMRIITAYWHEMRERAGLPGVRIHDLRHTFASHAAMNRETHPMIGRLLGHRSLGSTAIYFRTNALLIASDGMIARIGSLTADEERFMPWRTVDGDTIAPKGLPELEVMIAGALDRQRLLMLIRDFTVFGDAGRGIVKIIAGYHQFHAARAAVAATLRAVPGVSAGSALHERPRAFGLPDAAAHPAGDRRIGVIWHTQGSGKSFLMAFYAGLLVRTPALENPTIVVITDRNDLDDQLFATFSMCADLIRQTPVQATSREDLIGQLDRASGGVIFTTMQKFTAPPGSRDYSAISDRRNVIVIADEAHRSQYGFRARIDRKTGELAYGFAKYLRDALPNASFIGFTGTPIEKDDANTPAVFGDYVDVYDIARAVEDGATVPIYYESRLARIELPPEALPAIDAEIDGLTEDEAQGEQERLKQRWSAVEKLVGSKERLTMVAADLVAHFEDRVAAMDGKAMVVCMSRRITDAITRYHTNAVSTVEVLQTLIELAKEIRANQARGEDEGLTSDEIAFYDALADNESAVDIMGNDSLKLIAAELVTNLKANATVDWAHRESARARKSEPISRL